MNLSNMKIFISWSGIRSKAIANILRDWIPEVIQGAQPWMSSKDLNAGARWGEDLSRQLNQTNIGIICITPENINAPWINFEAGTIAKSVNTSLVCPFLYDIEPTNVKGPIAQFQMNCANEDGTFAIIRTLNSIRGQNKLSKDQLLKQFKRCWPELKDKLKKIPKIEQTKVERSDREILLELLENSRMQSRLLAPDSLLGLFIETLELDDDENLTINAGENAFSIKASKISLN